MAFRLLLVLGVLVFFSSVGRVDFKEAVETAPPAASVEFKVLVDPVNSRQPYGVYSNAIRASTQEPSRVLGDSRLTKPRVALRNQASAHHLHNMISTRFYFVTQT